MTRLRIFVARVLALFRGRSMDQALRRDIADHLDEATADFVRRGVSLAEARREALLHFGGVAQAEERHRRARTFVSIDQLRQDLRLGLRSLRHSPGFTAMVVAVLGVGVGATTAVFALLYAIVLKPLPFAAADRLVTITHSARGLNRDEVGLSPGLQAFYRQHATSLDAIAMYDEADPESMQLPDGDVVRVQLTYASHTLFDLLGIRPALGRLFTAEDGRPGFMNIDWPVPILLDHDFWRDRFGSDPTVVGRVIRMARSPRTIVGVLPEGFRFPDRKADVWMLEEPPPIVQRAFGNFGWSAVARLRSGVTAQQSEAELTRLLPQIAGAYPDATPARMATLRLGPIVHPLKEAIAGNTSGVLWTIFGGMGCLLVIACANVASLIGVRVDHRRREIAVRHALGAGRGDIVRLFAVEALTLATGAAIVGVGAARTLVWAVVSLTPVTLPRATNIAVGGAAVAFAAALSAALTCFYAALSARRSRDSTTNAGGDRATSSLRSRRLRSPVVTVQVALALTLMVGSALMLETYRNLVRRPLGFVADHVVTVEVTLPGSQASRHVQIYQDVVEHLRHVPGVDKAAAASFAPLGGGGDLFPVEKGDRPVAVKFITPGYFEAIGTPVLEGFGLGVNAPVEVDRPVLISAALAKRLYPTSSAIGMPIRRLTAEGDRVDVGGETPPFTIAGIVSDAREVSLRADPAEALYIPLITPPVELAIVPTEMSLIVRSSLTPEAVVAAARSTIAVVDPALTVGRVRTLKSIVTAARGTEVFVGTLLVVAASISLLLGIVGVYGSVAQIVRSRRREIGIRLALGAQASEVVRMVVSGTTRAVTVGAACGLGVAFAATGTLRALLFGVAPRDPLTFAAAALILLSAATGSAFLAARHAAAVNPTEALRVE